MIDDMLRSRWTVLAITVLCILPTVFPPVLPLLDLPGHLARYTVQQHVGEGGKLAQWYSYQWALIPNLGVDLLVEAFGRLLGTETVARIAVSASAGLTALGILQLSRALHGRITIAAIAALPLVFGYTFHYGFLNYNLALGLALCGGWLWIRLENWRPLRRWAAFALIASVIWTCHLVGWGIFCIIAGSRELLRNVRTRGLVRGVVATALVVSCVMVPIALGHVFGPVSDARGATEIFFYWPWKLQGLFQALRDRWHWFDVASVFGTIGFALVMWLHRRTKVDPGMALATAIMVACVIVLPHTVLGSEFADVRLIPATLIIALLAPRAGPKFDRATFRMLLIAAIAFAGVRIAYSGYSLWERGTRAAVDLRVLPAIPRNAELLTFRARPCGPMKNGWELDWHFHLAGYALVRRGAFSNDQWQIPGGQLIRVQHHAVQPYMVDPSEIVFETECGPAFPAITTVARTIPAITDYLWVIWDSPPSPLPGWTPIAQSGESIVYRRAR